MSVENDTPAGQQHGDVLGRGSGNMFIHVQRESGLAHRTLVLRPWQVQALRLLTSRWLALVLTVSALSWGYFAFQAARVPFLTRRITHLEGDSAKIDTLQATMNIVQQRYDQVQQMLSAQTRLAPVPPSPARAPAPATTPPTGTVASPATDTAKKTAAASAGTPKKTAAPNAADSTRKAALRAANSTKKVAPVKKPGTTAH